VKLSRWLTLAALIVGTSPASAHVDLNSPNGGEALTGGSSFTIQWMPAVAMHDTLNFDLWYSPAASSGPWTAIATDLPAGDLSVGSIHTFAWTVPNITDPSVWVRVRQDNNVDQDYEDISGSSFSITAALQGDDNGDGRVNAADYTAWRKTNSGVPAGYNTWRTHFGEGSGAAAVPELSSLSILLVGILSIYARRCTYGG
jgi:hypothetical protein